MINICASFPADGKCGVREVLSSPFQTKIPRARWVELDMVIPAFIVECSLVMILVDVTWQIRDVVKGKGIILNPHDLKIFHYDTSCFFLGLMVIGSTRCGGSTSPTLPKTVREPFRTLSIIVSMINP